MHRQSGRAKSRRMQKACSLSANDEVASCARNYDSERKILLGRARGGLVFVPSCRGLQILVIAALFYLPH
jgi:hypothetical protein